MIDAVGSSKAEVAAAAASHATTIDQNEFLTLFIAQIQNQDPLSPLNPEELTAQLAQFASLEQLTGVNDRLDHLVDAGRPSTTAALLGLLGREVSFDGSRIGVEKGQAPAIDYRLDAAAEGATATIRDASGALVTTVDLGRLGPGEHTFQFDGKDSRGQIVSDGIYQVSITTSATAGGVPTPLSLIATAPVDGIDFTSDPPVLVVGGRRISLDEVQRVQMSDDAE